MAAPSLSVGFPMQMFLKLSRALERDYHSSMECIVGARSSIDAFSYDEVRHGYV